MMMIVLRLLSLLGLKSRCHRQFSHRLPNKVVFQRSGESVDSWTPGLKPLCHRHPTGPHPSGLSWTPTTGDSTRSNVALGLRTQEDRRRVGEQGLAVLLQEAAQEGERLAVARDLDVRDQRGVRIA